MESDKTIYDIGLSRATVFALRRNGVHELSDLDGMTQIDLMKMRGIGKIKANEIMKKLIEEGVMIQ